MSHTTFDLVVSTQVRENYGAHDWDGQGECPQGWKMKGGNDVVVMEGLTISEVLSVSTANEGKGFDVLVNSWAKTNLSDDDYWCEYILGWELVEVSDTRIAEAEAAIREIAAERFNLELKEVLEHGLYWGEVEYFAEYSDGNPVPVNLMKKAKTNLLREVA